MTTARPTALRPRALWVFLFAAGLCLVNCGCSYLLFAGLLLGGPPTVEPAFDKETKESLTDKDVTVAVVCFAPDEVRYSFEDIDQELAKYVAFQLNKNKIRVIAPDRVKQWLDENRDWDYPEEIGAAFHCTHVVYIDLNEFTLFEEGSTTLYRGAAEAVVSVIKMDEDGEGEKIFAQEKISKFPKLRPRAAAEQSYNSFKVEYLTRLSDEIGRFFYEYYIADEIVDQG